MSGHKVYSSIVEAVEKGRLREPFGNREFKSACAGLGEGTYKAFLYKHQKGNGKNSELFIRVDKGRFKLIRPLKYF
jgi:hypothetical protein